MLGLFPAKVLVGGSRLVGTGSQCGTVAVEVVGGILQAHQVFVEGGRVVYHIVAVDTPGSAELQVVQPTGGVLHKLLLRDAPTDGGRREDGCIVVHTKAGGSIATDGERSQVAVVPIIIELAEVGYQSVFAGIVAHNGTGGDGIQVTVVQIFNHKPLAIAAERLAVFLLGLHTDQGGE